MYPSTGKMAPYGALYTASGTIYRKRSILSKGQCWERVPGLLRKNIDGLAYTGGKCVGVNKSGHIYRSYIIDEKSPHQKPSPIGRGIWAGP